MADDSKMYQDARTVNVIKSYSIDLIFGLVGYLIFLWIMSMLILRGTKKNMYIYIFGFYLQSRELKKTNLIIDILFLLGQTNLFFTVFFYGDNFNLYVVFFKWTFNFLPG